jgi:hypothetical protein
MNKKPVKLSGMLDHLACRYYRFFPSEGQGTLTVNLETPGMSGRSLLRGYLAAVTRQMHCSAAVPLQPSRGGNSPTGLQSGASLTVRELGTIDHFVLVICNVGNRISDPREFLGPDDQQTYTATVQAR